MTFRSKCIAGLAVIILAISNASAEALVHPSGARGATAARPAAGPPTWWPQSPSCSTTAAKQTTPRHADDSNRTDVRGMIIAVLTLAVVVASAGGVISGHRRTQPDACHEEFRRITVR